MTMTSTNTEELKMARIGPIRAIATECFAPPSNDDKKAEAETAAKEEDQFTIKTGSAIMKYSCVGSRETKCSDVHS